MPPDIPPALHAARVSQQRYRALFDQAPVGVFFYDGALCITECNARFVAILASTYESLIGLDMRTLADHSVVPAIERALDGGAGFYEGAYAATTSSARMAVSMRTSPLRDDNGIVVGGMGVVEDITARVHDVEERAAAEQALKRSEARFRELIERAPDAIGVFSRDRKIVYANAALATLLGYDNPEDLIGMYDWAPIHPDDRPALEARKPHMFTGQPLPPHEYRMVRRDGGGVHVEVLSLTIEYDGQPAVLSFARDLSERKIMQARLLLSDRLVSVGTLAAGVAHEINNPLAYVMANLDMAAQRRLPRLEAAAREKGETAIADAAAQITEMIEIAREGAERVRAIVKDLKTFARADDERRGPVDVRRVLDASINMAWNEIRHRAKLVKEYDAVPVVWANEARIGQVFLNILLNAAQALQVGAAAGNAIHVRTSTSARGEAVVEVSDEGPGMAPDVLGRIFDPFFTTKPVGHGTGLGLWICEGIITALGGSIHAESRPGSGSTFRVVLPAQRESDKSAPALASSHATPSSSSSMRRGRVLVVDDEAALARTLAVALSDEHDVVASGSGRDALALLRKDDRFDVVLCDLMMPDVTGMDVYEAMQREKPSLASRFVFVTGGAFTVRAREFMDTVSAPRLEKPFAMKTLLDLLRRRVEGDGER
jgi:PAS domain S-box-containing protein